MSQWLFERLDDFGERPALVWNDRTFDYQNLLKRIDRWREQLAHLAIMPGESVAVAGDFCPELCALFLALLQNRNIVTPLRPNAPKEHPEYLQTACVGPLFEFMNNDEWHISMPKVEASHPLLDALRRNGDAGWVLFTSGSTGQSKASLLSANRLLERFRRKRVAYRTLFFLGLDHIGGLNTLFHVFAEGGALICSGERTPKAVAQTIERHRVELLPTTPTFLKMLLLSGAAEAHDLSSLRLITYGTEPMPESTLGSLNRAFPNVRLKQTYGLSELGILPTSSPDSQSLWIKVGGDGYETKVVDGILWIRAVTAMLGYLNAPTPFDPDGWFITGDAVETRGDEMRILGRASEIINVGGDKVYPAEVESVLLQMDNILDATVYGKANPLMGKVVAAKVRLRHPEEREALEQRVREFCRSRLEEYKIPMLVVIDEQEQFNARFKKDRRRVGN